MSCGVGFRCGLELALLQCRPAAVAPIGPLAWEPSYAAGTALKSKKKKKKGGIFLNGAAHQTQKDLSCKSLS